MALATEDKAEIIQIIRDTMSNGCICKLGPETSSEVAHFFGRIKDLGEGNLNKGIEEFSAIVRMVNKHRKFGESVGGKVAVFLLYSFIMGIITLLGLGIVSWVKKVIVP